MIAQRLVRFLRGLYARIAREHPLTRRVLIAILFVMPGGLGIVFFYLLFRSFGIERASGRTLLVSQIRHEESGPGRAQGTHARAMPVSPEQNSLS